MALESGDLRKLERIARRKNRMSFLGRVFSVKEETADSTLGDRLKINVSGNTAARTDKLRDEDGNLIADAHIEKNDYRRQVTATKNGEVVTNDRIKISGSEKPFTVGEVPTPPTKDI